MAAKIPKPKTDLAGYRKVFKDFVPKNPNAVIRCNIATKITSIEFIQEHGILLLVRQDFIIQNQNEKDMCVISGADLSSNYDIAWRVPCKVKSKVNGVANLIRVVPDSPLKDGYEYHLHITICLKSTKTNEVNTVKRIINFQIGPTPYREPIDLS